MGIVATASRRHFENFFRKLEELGEYKDELTNWDYISAYKKEDTFWDEVMYVQRRIYISRCETLAGWMAILSAPEDEILRVFKFAKVCVNAPEKCLDFKKARADFGFEQLWSKYMHDLNREANEEEAESFSLSARSII